MVKRLAGRINLLPFRLRVSGWVSGWKTGRRLRRALAWFCIAAILVTLLGNIRPLVDRTALVTAETTTLTARFDSEEFWLIEQGMELCLPNPDLRAAARSSDPVCRQFLRGGSFTRLAIFAGDRLEIRFEPEGGLLVRFLPCEEGPPASPRDCSAGQPDPERREIRPIEAPNGFLAIPATALRAAGPLPLSGRITLGRGLEIGGGAEFLQGGSYEIREQTWLSRLFGRRSVVIERGDLIPGSEVSLLSHGAVSDHSTGHFFLTGEAENMRLQVVALAGDDGSLRMSLRGVEDFEVDPDWIDSVIANPIFFALAFLAGLMLNMMQLLSPFVRREEPKQG